MEFFKLDLGNETANLKTRMLQAHKAQKQQQRVKTIKQHNAWGR